MSDCPRHPKGTCAASVANLREDYAATMAEYDD